MRVN